MPAPYGVVPTGFNVKPRDAILTDIETVQLAEISPSLDVQATSLLGINNGIVAQAVADAWLALAATYAARDPDSATDSALTSVALLTGTERQGANPTVVVATVNVDGGFNAAPETMFASIVGNPAAIFTNVEEVDNPGGSPADFPVTFRAINPGPQQCLAGTLTVIAQALTGWNSVTNAEDGTVGNAVESDPNLRLKRQQELSRAGSSTAAAIRADILTQMQPPVTTSATINVTVLHNDTNIVDANNLPSHSIEVIAYQPGNTSDDDQLLADAIAVAKADGIDTYGLASKMVTDDQGISQAIRYTRPAPLVLYVAITVRVDATFPLDGADLVKQELVDYAQLEFGPGQEVILDALKSCVYPQPADSSKGVQGVKKVTSFAVGLVPSPVTTADIPVNVRQVADFDTARISVTVTT